MAQAHPAEIKDPPPRRRVTPFDLFFNFAMIGAVGFGGVMPWVRWLLVEKRAWLTEEEFLNLFALSNFLPGGNVMHIAVITGSRFSGLAGGAAALAGLVAPAATLVLVVATLYERYSGHAEVRSMIQAVAAAAGGLVLATGIKMLRPLLRSPRAVAVVAVVLFSTLWLNMPLLWMLLLILPLSVAAAALVKR